MAKMLEDFTLKSEANGPKKAGDPVAHAEDEVNILETKEVDDAGHKTTWLKVELVKVGGQGWTPADKVDAAAAANVDIDLDKFAKQCVEDAVFVGVNAHLLM